MPDKDLAEKVLEAEGQDTRPEILDTDLANGERLARTHGRDLRYTVERGWFVWTGLRWEPNTALAIRKAKDTARAIFDEIKASEPDNQKALFQWARRSQSAERLRAMLFLAESEPGIPARFSDFDRDPWLLTCLNGTLNLRTGELREHRRNDLISKYTPIRYAHDAPCDTWRAFLDRVLAGNESLISYLQRAVGYSLTGSAGAQCLFFLYGSGANGKSVLLETVQGLLGEYSLATSIDTFALRKHGTIPNDIARLAGARFVAVSETAEGQRLNETLVKDLTGGDTICARFLHREFFDFRPEFKLWVRGNHKPVIRGTDDAIWRRIHLLPFHVQIPEPERDPGLPERLRAELPGILAWAVQGCLMWQKQGLRPPQEVQEAIREYRTEMDVLGAFLAERCQVDVELTVEAGELYKAYQEWARETGEYPVTQTRFGTAMTERGFRKDRTGRRRLYRGIDLSVTGMTSYDEYSDVSPHSARVWGKTGNTRHNPSHSSQNGGEPGDITNPEPGNGKTDVFASCRACGKKTECVLPVEKIPKCAGPYLSEGSA